MSRTALFLLAVVLFGAMMPWLLSSAASKKSHVKISDGPALGKERSSEAQKDKSQRAAINRGVTSNVWLVRATRNANAPLDQRMQLRRSGTMPHRLQNHLEPLSSDLEQRPQPIFSVYALGMVGQDVTTRGSHTQRIMDIFRYAVGH